MFGCIIRDEKGLNREATFYFSGDSSSASDSKIVR